MECPKCGGARSVCKCLWFSKESLDKALYPEKTLRDKITSLQARVKELEAERDLLKTQRDNVSNRERYHLEECARRGKVVDAVRKHCPVIQLREDQPIGKALRELDGEKAGCAHKNVTEPYGPDMRCLDCGRQF